MFFQKSDPAGYMNRKIDFARPYTFLNRNLSKPTFYFGLLRYPRNFFFFKLKKVLKQEISLLKKIRIKLLVI